MSQNSPFKFLDSYTKEDRDIFFGREKEIEEIYSRVFESQLLLVYGASGTGKSSLIQCGLANKFEDADWQPINIRRGLNINDSLLQQLNKLALTPIKPSKEPAKLLTKSLKSIYLDYFKPIYLIFDQFEELFIFGERDEWMEFIGNIKSVLESDINVKFIFVIRGEYLEYLSEFEDIVPEFFNNRIRIEKMTRQSALRCITGPCEKFNIEVEEQFAENLLHKLSPEKSEIELTYLQVFLDRIHRNAQSSGGSGNIVFTNAQLEALGNIGDVLSEFLDEQIDKTDKKEVSLALLKAFVTSQGTKKQVSVKDASDFVKVLGHDLSPSNTEKVILDLVNRRILKDKDEAGRYELRHDSIAAKIYQKITQYEKDLIEVKNFLDYAYSEHKKRDFLLNESDLAYVLPYRDRLLLSKELNEFIQKSEKAEAKKKRSRKQLYTFVFSVSGLLIIAIGMFIYALISQREAENNLIMAEQEQQKAIESARMAEEQKQIAEINAVRADSAARIALELQSVAEQNARLATIQSVQARREKERADANADSALIMSQIALERGEQAQQSALAAQQSALEATQLRYLSIAKTLATKSVQIKDLELKILLSLLAKKFNDDFNGYPYDADIYTGLLSSQEAIKQADFNKYSHSGDPIQEIIQSGEMIVLSGPELKWVRFSGLSFASRDISSFRGLPNDISASSDKSSLAIGFQEGYVQVLSGLNSERKVQQVQLNSNDPVFLVEYGASNNLYAATDAGKLYSIQDSTASIIAEFDQRITALCVQSDSSLFVGFEDGSIRSVKQDGKNALAMSPLLNGSVTELEINEIIGYLSIGYENGTIRIIDLDSRKFVQTLSAHEATVTVIRYSADGKTMLTGSMDRSAKIWNLETLNELPISLEDLGDWILSASFTEDGNYVIVGDASGNLIYFPTSLNDLTSGLCEEAGRNLSEEEWETYVGQGLEYMDVCSELTSSR